jgi:cellulose synthase/poly-beta-1,6-N-acetylglucosamine synthase-like glycosyltransferase
MNYLRKNLQMFDSSLNWFEKIAKNVLDNPKSLPKLSESRSSLYLFIFGAWGLSIYWFNSRLMSLLNIANSSVEYWALLFFVIFTEIAWLYAFYNVGVIIFAAIYRTRHSEKYQINADLNGISPAIALLYTTCNDFCMRSVLSCVEQDYSNYTVYILDDSSDSEYKKQVDDFAGLYPDLVKVVRRPDRTGFKAGNINNGLSRVATDEPFFAIADADEILPKDFLTRTVKRILANDRCGFVQANHKSNPDAPSSLASSLGPGIDAHWKWYHPLRNRYGFVMLLGHGALLRRKAWEDIGGFPEIVSEDLAFALRIREHGWRGHFAEDIVCYEDFPETIRAFRIRHMKWTRGTCEFLWKEMKGTILSRKISWVEKLDVIFPTINLPLALFYFLYLVDANIVMALFFSRPHPLTVDLGATEIVLPTYALDSGFSAIMSMDFYAITLMTLTAPILCFIIELYRKPLVLWRFLAKSTAIYGTLGPLSCIGVVFYALTGKAVFHVTADKNQSNNKIKTNHDDGFYYKTKKKFKQFFRGSHPDSKIIQGFEVLCGFTFALICLKMFQISFLGLALGFMLLPIMHHISWENRFIQKLIYLPISFLVVGLTLGGLSIFGLQTALFGFGLHF